ncbi:related to purine-cytosine permease [Cephalotrichum gorgonifer]|uniref:Related to purine-cytosine permease n=1 Tax=Cephalotrichum gorgonifer TaxID=2041049 RepID=A0AAE8N280_9PEZI|nr:related to purine-cytosine permease [Cephalotrichum gorgonifer]
MGSFWPRSGKDEQDATNPATPVEVVEAQDGEVSEQSFPLWEKTATSLGIEIPGSEPVEAQLQTERRYLKLFTLWFSMNFNLIAISTGMTGTLSFGLGLRDCALIIIFFGLFTAFFTPYLSQFGHKLGLRQMIHARYSFGLYGSAIPILLNMATLTGYGIVGSILGGQALSAIKPDELSVTVGIVIIALVALGVTFCGSRWIHIFDLYSWLPSLVATLGALGCSGKHLHLQAEAPPATASTVLSFGALVGGFFLPWAAIASDFSTYFDRRSKSAAVFIPTYLGLVLGAIPMQILGAAIGGAVPNIPAWEAGFERNSVGGVMGAMLEPVGGFGKFLLVLMALSVLANVIGTIYALSLNFQSLMFLARLRLPRVVYTVVITAIIIPIAIKVAAEFLDSLNNFLGLISYWPACFISVVVLEHVVFRKGKMEDGYDVSAWNVAGRLPSGIAALAASVLSFGLVIPGMYQLWFVGPIAEKTGDIGFEMAFAVTLPLYVLFRTIEIKIQGRV